MKGVGVLEEWNEEMLLEYKRCSEDSVYFCKKYGRVLHLDRGLVPFELYPYQERMVRLFEDNRFSVVLSPRQSGKSMAVIAFAMSQVVFNRDTSVLIMANKERTARMLVSRMMRFLENLPFYMQPGAWEYNKSSIVFENGSSIESMSTTSDSARGSSANILVLDEFAFAPNAHEFYTSVYPIVTSGETTKVIISSTPNGIGNPFHKIYTGAVAGLNNYKHMKVHWWDVPGRDEAWKKETIANTSETQFRQEYSVEFLGSSNTLIGANALLGLKALQPVGIEQDGLLKVYREPEDGHSYVVAADTGKGRGQDHSALSVIDVTTKPFEQVATFRDNLISPLIYPNVIWRLAQRYNDAFVIVENNDVGDTVANVLYHDLEYDHMYVMSSLKSRRSGGANAASNIGLNMNKRVKHVGCSHLKDLVEEGKLVVHDEETIFELSTFVAKGKSWEADTGCHDDLVMGLVCFSWFAASTAFGDATDNDLRKMLYEQRMRDIDDDMLPAFEHHDAADDAEDGWRRTVGSVAMDVPPEDARDHYTVPNTPNYGGGDTWTDWGTNDPTWGGF